MGAPGRNRRQYDKPKNIWDLERIKSSAALIDAYGLKNMKELWIAQTEIGRIRRNARELLSATGGSESIKDTMFKRLERIGLAKPGATLDNLLDLKENSLLERRLQTVVFRKGLAKTIKQARQLTVHGFIAINGKKVSRPGYTVDVKDEASIAYYRPIDVMTAKQVKEAVAAAAPAAAAPETPAAPEKKEGE